MRIHSLIGHSYGQHGELQQTEIVKWVFIGCVKAAAKTFYLFLNQNPAIFQHYTYVNRENKELPKLLINLRGANIFQLGKIYEKMLCKMKYMEVVGGFIANNKTQVSTRCYFSK